ncbi:MAG: flagellar hook protein FlgE [Betaproteobacteria bacterium]|nr:flagellar hook protein FlgE [Betaproteobacteria bacterium]
MSFQQGLSGLNAAARNLEVIGNNVANANTIGFKGSRAQFADIYANALGAGGSVGIGTNLSKVAQQFGQGNLTSTSNPLDIAINGDGFFRVSQNGAIGYSRNGQFELDKDGYVVTMNGARLTGYPADALGNIAVGTPGDLRIDRGDLAPKVTTEAGVSMNLDSRKGVLPAGGFKADDPTTYHGSTSMSVYDSLGNEHAVALYFVKTAANTWSVFAQSDGVAVGAGAAGALNFATDGTIDTATTTLPFALSIATTNGSVTPLAVDLDFEGTTQYGSTTAVNELVQDGYASGKISGFNVGADGTILARYSNGKTLAQGQVALANFVNPQGLAPLGGNLWGETSASGQPLVGSPGTGTMGALQGGALEESNVDLTQELVNMITAQRVYQANAQTIKTQDSVMQTLVNLR